ncbi:MAG: TonB-dependent receptor, partial [Dehalococcoidia bacterium]
GMAMAGNVNIISKSGTNAFHGSGFWGYQNGEWNSPDFITGRTAPGTYNTYGGSLGGPIMKNKLFFFGAFEAYDDNRDEPNAGNVPSRQIRDMATAANPPTQAFWDLYPLPTGAEAPGATQARFEGTFARTAEDKHFIGRLDYNLSANDLVTVRFSRGRPKFLDPSLAIGNSRDRRGTVDNFAATYTRVFGSNVTSEFRLGYNKNRTERIDLMWENQVIGVDLVGTPSTAGEGFIKYGTAGSFENTWSWIHGRHSFKFGGLYRFWRGSRFNEETPNYSFSSFADLAANRADRAEYQFALQDFQIRSFDAGFFVQDDIRLSDNFMLNPGLRWDYSGVPTERDGRYYNRVGPFGGADGANPGVVQYRDPDSVYEPFYGMISPRLGFAWTANPETVVRGGAGIFYQPFNLFSGPVEIVQNSLGEPVEFIATGEQLAQLGIAYPDPSSVVRPLVSGSCDLTNFTCPQNQLFITDSSLDINRKNPYSLQWTIGVSRRLTETLAFDIGYVGNKGQRLTFSPENNR